MASVLQEWQPTALRLTLFPASPLSDRPSLESLYGVALESTQIVGPSKDVTEIASFGAGKLSLAITGSRIDLVWTGEQRPEGYPNLGDAASAIQTLIKPAIEWIRGQSLSLSRLAFGGTYIQPVEARDEGYVKLAQYLPAFGIDPATTFDFMLQVNRKASVQFRNSTVALNRLSKWGVQFYQPVTVSIAPGGTNAMQLGPESFAVACEQDFSTPAPAMTPPLTGPESAELLQHLVDMGAEFLIRGDHV